MDTKNPQVIIKADCPKCGPSRRAAVCGFVETRWGEDEHPISGSDEYRLLKCEGCEGVSLQRASWCSEDDYDINPYTGEATMSPRLTSWPSLQKHPQPPWTGKLSEIDYDLGSIVEELYAAHNLELSVLTAIGIRTAFDRATTLIGVDPGLSFNAKLGLLLKDGKIGGDEHKALDALTDAGGAAAHRGWRPTGEQLITMLLILEGFLHRSLIYGANAQKLKAAVPPRPGRKQAVI